MLSGLGQGILHDVGRIEPSGQTAVHPHGHHAAEAIAMQGQEPLPGRVLAAPGPHE